MNAVEEATNAEDDEVNTEETDEVFSGVKDDETHDGATHTAEDPSETVGRVDSRAETRDDFEETTEEGVSGDNDEMPSRVLTDGEEKGEGDDGVDDCETDRDSPTGLLAGAIDGVDEFDDREGQEEGANKSHHRVEVMTHREKGETAKKDGDKTLDDENEPMGIDIFTVDMRHVCFSFSC